VKDRGDLPVIAFVHGCTQGPAGWDRVRNHLTHVGVSSVAVDLRQEEFGDATTLECAHAIVEQTKRYERVALAGTSCSGLLIPVVACLRPVDRLVFICAGLPDVGRSATDQIYQDGLLHSDWRDWPGEPDDPEAASRFMFNDCPTEAIQWSLSTVRLFLPTVVYNEVTPLVQWPDSPMTYLLGTRDRIISQVWARRTVPRRLGCNPIELPTGHCPQNSNPELLAQVLGSTVGASPTV
jgi:pimeloyl-ACP methyl ester carboxylesterase